MLVCCPVSPPRPPPIGHVGVYSPRREQCQQLVLVTISVAAGVLGTLGLQYFRPLPALNLVPTVTQADSIWHASHHGAYASRGWSPPRKWKSDLGVVKYNGTHHDYICDQSIPFLDGVAYVHVLDLPGDTRGQAVVERLCRRFLDVSQYGGWYQKWSDRTICAAFSESPRRGIPLLAEGLEFGAVCTSPRLLHRLSKQRHRSSPRGRCWPAMSVDECSTAVMRAVKQRRWLVLSPLALAARAAGLRHFHRLEPPRAAGSPPDTLQPGQKRRRRLWDVPVDRSSRQAPSASAATLWLEFGSWCAAVPLHPTTLQLSTSAPSCSPRFACPDRRMRSPAGRGNRHGRSPMQRTCWAVPYRSLALTPFKAYLKIGALLHRRTQASAPSLRSSG